jgi:hemoglobin
LQNGRPIDASAGLLYCNILKMKKDIEQRAHIEQIVDHFYEKVRRDPAIGYIFNDIAKVDWQHHLPVMYAFWESIVLNKNSYSGNPMAVHAKLNAETPLTAAHFKQWLHLFTTTVDELFEGRKAQLAKERAASIAAVIEAKVPNDSAVTQAGIVPDLHTKRKEDLEDHDGKPGPTD